MKMSTKHMYQDSQKDVFLHGFAKNLHKTADREGLGIQQKEAAKSIPLRNQDVSSRESQLLLLPSSSGAVDVPAARCAPASGVNEVETGLGWVDFLEELAQKRKKKE